MNRADDQFAPVAETLERRRFIKSAVGLAALSTQPIYGAIRGLAAPTGERPKATFFQFNDTHVQAPFEKPPEGTGRVLTYARANEKCRRLVDEINRTQPDFALAMGDMIHGQKLERLAPDMAVFKDIIAPLKCPLYPNLGNHEVVQREGNAEYEKAYRDLFGDERVNYSFERSGLLFVMVNNSGATGVADDVRTRRNAWFRNVLEKSDGRPIVVGCHIPLVAVRDEPTLAKSFGYKSYRAHDEELLGLVDKYSKSIVAVLSGHLHLTGCTVRNGVHHISICGTASYPSDYARFALYDDRLEMEVRQLPEELATSAPTLHGKPRHADDFTDATHRSAQEYQLGRADERRLVMPLRRS